MSVCEPQAEKRSSSTDMSCGFLDILLKSRFLSCFLATAASIVIEIHAIVSTARRTETLMMMFS